MDTRNTAITDTIFRGYDYDHRQAEMFGAFRAAITLTLLPSSIKPSWELRDNINRFQDGTSNQYLFAEKHIPSDRLGKCFNSSGCTGDPTYGNAEQWGWFDCGVQIVRSDPDTPTDSGQKYLHIFFIFWESSGVRNSSFPV
jgi:hypothetical protein